MKLLTLATTAILFLCCTASISFADDILVLPESVEIIEEEAFWGDKSIKKVVLPDGIKEIRARAFASSSLEEINLPASLQTIADDAFADTNLKNILVDLNSFTLDQIIANAKREDHVESVGMPDNWVNWKETWDDLFSIYGINHIDTDMSSAEALYRLSIDSFYDIGDIGINFIKDAIDRNLVQGYKTSYWDSVPDWAKDEDGKWMIPYAGATAFIFNNSLCADPMPTSWHNIRTGSYKITIGDVVGGATAQAAVLASAYAFGGDMEHLQPAFDFWIEMANANRIDTGNVLLSRIQNDEIKCGVTWSYNALRYRNSISNYNITCGIPIDGAILVGYASIINKNSDNPFAAALAREYIFSDAGQINLAKSGAIPTRSNVEIPFEVIAATFDPATYANAVGISDAAKYSAACENISNWWADNILPLLQ